MKRGVIAGWSTQAASRHVAWLQSVDSDALASTWHLFAYTLTVRDCPASSDDFHRMRRAWEKRLRRAIPQTTDTPPPGAGLAAMSDDAETPPVDAAASPLLVCWVMELQARGVPHLHGIIGVRRDLASELEALSVVSRAVHVAWPEVAGEGTRAVSQDVRLVVGTLGWFQYLAKHIGRGAAHRQRESLPPGWESSGRLWGHSTGWPTVEPLRFHLDRSGWYELRRLVHAYALASARSERVPAVRRRRIAYLRRRRRVSADVSPWVGLREWASPDVILRLLEHVATSHEVVNLDTGEVLGGDAA